MQIIVMRCENCNEDFTNEGARAHDMEQGCTEWENHAMSGASFRPVVAEFSPGGGIVHRSGTYDWVWG